MTSLDRIMELLVFAFFLFAGVSKIFSYRQQSRFIPAEPDPQPSAFPYWSVALLGFFEIAAALALFTPATPALISAIALAMLTVATVVFRLRRKQSAAPTIALFLMVLFIIVGRLFNVLSS
jgi:uncharacterized membrane protein YphA (DoxX/SURF4 family)